jgi:phosphoglycolate phosphatase
MRAPAQAVRRYDPAMLVLFDIDGTLLLSKGAGMQCFLQAGSELFAREFSREGLYFGGGLDPLIWRSLCALNGIPESAAAEQHDRFRVRYAQHLQARLASGTLAQALPGVPELLAALGARAARGEGTVGLLTGNYPETGALKLAAAGLSPEQFPVAAWGCDGGHRRDLVPVALARCEERTGRRVRPEEVVIVGDTPHDVDCAAAHGCRSLGVATGAHPVEELAACGATRAVADLSDTGDILAWMTGATVPRHA